MGKWAGLSAKRIFDPLFLTFFEQHHQCGKTVQTTRKTNVSIKLNQDLLDLTHCQTRLETFDQRMF